MNKKSHVFFWLGGSLAFLGALVALMLHAAAGHAAGDLPRFILHTAEGADQAGTLTQIGADWKVILNQGDDYIRAGADKLVSLRRRKTPRPAPPTGEQILLVNGDILPGQVVELIGERLSFRYRPRQEWKVPLPAIAVIWLAAPDGTEHPDRLRRALAAGKRTRDTVYLRNGDILEGVLSHLDRKQVQIEVNEKNVPVAFSKVAAIAMNSDLARLASPTGVHARVVLADGTRLTLASAQSRGDALTGKAAFGGEVAVAVPDLVALELQGGAAVALSTLKPTRYEARSFLGSVRWPYVADGNVWNGALRIAGETHDRGLGMHAQSRLTYALDGAYRRFEARVGLDDRSPATAAARIAVLVDGKPRDLGDAAHLTRRGLAWNVGLDIAGARELVLVVDFVPRVGTVPGDADWCGARLIRK
jgi:hypothetical protein